MITPPLADLARPPRRRLVVPALACALLLPLLASCGGGGGGGGGGSSPPLVSGGQSGGWVTPTQTWWIGTADEIDPADLHPVYTLTNIGSAPLEWTVDVSVGWLSIPGPEQGTLPPGAAAQIVVDVDAYAADQDGFGPAVGLIHFVDAQSSNELAERTVLVDSSFADWGDGGWTPFDPSPDTRVVYVSPSGSDAQSGLSPATAKRTVAAGIALLRNGYPDWLLLERGGTWNESLGQWIRSGRSADEPMLVASYGTAAARPKLITGLQHGIATSGGGGSPPTIDYLALVGLEFQPSGYTGAIDIVGARMLQPGTYFLVEDCVFRGYGVNLVFQGYGGRHTDFRVRRSVIVDAWSLYTNGHSQGLYAHSVDGLLVEDNVFDHNGWNEAVPGGGATIFNHNLYIDNGNTGVVVRGNIIANAASHGMQLRPGGVCVNNLFVRNSIALSVGGGTNPDAGGVIAEVHQNVIMDGKNIDGPNPRGWGLWLGNIATGNVSENVIANNVAGSAPRAISLVGDPDSGLGVHDLVLEDNVVHDWGGNLIVEGDNGQLTGVTLLENHLQDHTHAHPLVDHDVSGSLAALTSGGNRCYSQLLSGSQWTKIGTTLYALTYWQSLVGDVSTTAEQVEYVDATRSPASYNALLGGTATLSAFLAKARLQSAADWKPEYTAVHVNDYLRGGFQTAP